MKRLALHAILSPGTEPLTLSLEAIRSLPPTQPVAILQRPCTSRLVNRPLARRQKTYTTSGNYTFQTTNIAGCDSIVTLHLTVNDCSLNYDTVYFCTGLNTEHEEVLDETLIRRYLPYVYESPAEWNYMEDVIIVSEHDRMQVDLKRAEQNLYEHYQDNLTPIKSIAWSYRPDGGTAYIALEVTDEPQWIATGTVVVTVRFVCGQLFTSDFETNVVTVNGDRLEMNGRKVLENGQIVIIRGGLKYSILGTRLE